MEFVNATRMESTCTVTFDAEGREVLVVVIKGTFQVPGQDGDRLRLHEVQQPLTLADEFFGDPGHSSPRRESDFALRKPRCDVLLNATARAPGGRPTARTTVGVQIGAWSKSFDVVGDRRWVCGAFGARATAPEPFAAMPITYGHAFGGTDDRHPDPARHAAFLPNPVGRGFHAETARRFVDGAPLPNTEETGRVVDGFDGGHRPMSFGPIGRHWAPRVGHAGTYDRRWMEETFPFLPADFDERYFQAAPPDQQLPKFQGDQRVTLTNLTRSGRREFVLPHFEAPVFVFRRGGGRSDLHAELDTVFIEPDDDTVALTWRLALPLRRDIFELAQVVVGRKDIGWWRARAERGESIPIAVATAPVAGAA